MPDPIWLDNNIVDRAIKGDVDIRSKLAAYRSQGRPLLITPWVRTELLDGGKVKPNADGTYPLPSTTGKGMKPAQRSMAEAELTKLGIEVDTRGQNVPYDVKQRYFDTKPTGGGISNADRTVLTEVKIAAEARGVKNPEMMTAELGKKAMADNTKAWGITPVVHTEPFKPPPAPVKPPSGGGSGGGSSGAPPASGSAPPASGGTAGGSAAKAPKSTAPTADQVKADQAKARTVAPKAPNIRIDDYPPERKGPVTRFFEDKPVLKKAGLFATNTAAGEIKGKILEKVTAHFVEAASKGAAEFRAAFPASQSLMQAVDLDRLHKAATQALVAVVSASGAPPDLKPFGRDRVAATRALVAWLRKSNAKPAASRAYEAAAQAYIDALSDVVTKIAKLREPMQPIAEDIQHRASILLKTGNDFEELFWKFAPIAAATPITYYEWFDVHAVATAFQGVGGAVASLADEIRSRMAEYDAALAKLYDELQATSDLQARFAPN